MLGMLAEIYIDNLRQETTKGKVQRARDGFWNGNIPLCWLLVSSARICVVNSQKPKYKKPTFEGRFFVVTCSKSYILRSRRG
jgi:DNA invertase Pin-like site-specific DNA recombinase